MAAFIAEKFGSGDLFARHGLETELEIVHLPQGECLFEQGEPGDCMYVHMQGRLGVRLRKADGSEMDIDELEPGVTVGEMALLTRQVRGTTVHALTDAQLVKCSREEFECLAEVYPQELASFAKGIALRLSDVGAEPGSAFYSGQRRRHL